MKIRLFYILPFNSHNNRNIYKSSIHESAIADEDIHKDYLVFKVKAVSPEEDSTWGYGVQGPLGSEECSDRYADNLSGLAGLVVDEHTRYVGRHHLTEVEPKYFLADADFRISYKTPADIIVDGDEIIITDNLSSTEKEEFVKGLQARNSLYWNANFDNLEEFIKTLPKLQL